MKNYSNIFRTMAALLLTGAVFSACTPDEDMLVKRTYTLTIDATQGYNDATKGLTPSDNNIVATWDEGETVIVKNNDNDSIGYLTAASSGQRTTLSGEITDAITEGTSLHLVRGKQNFTSQDGTLGSIATHCDKATCVVTVTEINGTTVSGTHANFENQQAIVYFDFKKEGGDLSVKSLSIGVYSIDLGTPSTSAIIALPGSAFNSTITATENVAASTEYSCTGASLTNGQVYHIQLNMKPKTTK